jgi:hypothetical protein
MTMREALDILGRHLTDSPEDVEARNAVYDALGAEGRRSR